MSNLPQDTEEFLFNPSLLSSFSSDHAVPSLTLREQRSEIWAIKSEIAQHSQILSSLSTQISQLVDLFSATPAGEPPTPVHSPPPRRISQVFSPTHGNTALPPGQSITVMSTKLAESAPILSTFNLYDVILYTRAYVDWTTRAGPHPVPPPFCTGIHADVLETVCTELQMQYQDFRYSRYYAVIQYLF